MRACETHACGDRDARVDVELQRAAADQRARAGVATDDAVLEAIRGTTADVTADLQRAGVNRIALELERVARLEQRLVEAVLPPAEEHRADDADRMRRKVAELDRRRGAVVFVAERRLERADAA